MFGMPSFLIRAFFFPYTTRSSPGRDIGPFLASQMKAFFFCSFLFFCFNPSFTAADSPEYRDCAPASCNGVDVNYPFSLYASTPGTSCSFPGLGLTCEGDKADALRFLITPTGLKLIVKSINYTTQTIKLAIDRNLLVVKNGCPLPSGNITLPDITDSYGESILSFATNYTMGTFFFGCSTKPNFTGVADYSGDIPSYNFTSNLVSGCSNPGATSYSYSFSDDSFNNPLASWTSCRRTLSFPVLTSSSSHDAGSMSTFLTEGFEMLWTVNSMGDCLGCTASGGRCGYNTTGDHFLCFCRQDAHSVNCNQPDAPSPSSSRESLSDSSRAAGSPPPLRSPHSATSSASAPSAGPQPATSSASAPSAGPQPATSSSSSSFLVAKD